MKTFGVLISLAAALIAPPTSATEWLSCFGKPHGFDILIGGSTGAASIDDFSFYVQNTVPEPSKSWKVTKRDLDLSKQTVRFEARSLKKGVPNIAVAIKGNRATFKVDNAVEEAECDWSQLESEAQPGVPADGLASLRSARRR